MDKPRLAISFSGGRSSAVMGQVCLDKYSDTHDIFITFVNTGCEPPATLDFVDACDRHIFGGRVHWIEAVINGPGKGATAKRVTYETADRDGTPFRAAIEKHGIFCKSHPQCTSRLKEEPMNWHRKQHGWAPGTYDTAIGIRVDEADRMSSKAEEKRLVYPLVKYQWTKDMVNKWLAQFDWDLKLPSDAWGNCTWCWKKSLRKLMTVARHDPSQFDFPLEMESLHQFTKSPDGRSFFRENRTAKDILEMSKQPFREYSDKALISGLFDDQLDIGSACGESCEIGADQ